MTLPSIHFLFCKEASESSIKPNINIFFPPHIKEKKKKKRPLHKNMDAKTMVISLILLMLFFPFCTSVDTLTPDQSIKDGQSLISNKNNFALGFFSPGNPSYRYLGIWFVKVPNQTIVWVANRNDPIIDSSGVLSINHYGNLVLHDSSNRLLWSTNV